MNIVEAVKTLSDAEVISRKLIKNARGNTLYSDIWRFGINTALRISDLLSLTFDDVSGNKLTIKEGKTGRPQKLSATPDLSGTVLPLCPIPNSALKNAPPFKSVMPKASACAGSPA